MKCDYSKVNMIERKVLRKIFGPVFNTEMRTDEIDIILMYITCVKDLTF